MGWEKLGRVYEPDKAQWWSQYYGILPTPVVDQQLGVIRIFFASADAERFGRIFSLDVDMNDPTRLVGSVRGPLLDVGELGTFDDCGVNPSCVVQRNGQTRLYYVGYQRSHRVPYLLLTGVASFEADGTLLRTGRTPLLERTSEEPWIRSAPTIIDDGGRLRMWYVSATEWSRHDSGQFHGRLMPKYNVRYAESLDGIDWKVIGGPSLETQAHEFGFGRPWVVRSGSRLLMWYSIRRVDRAYRIGYAESLDDGVSWSRRDADAGIDVSSEGWDSEMICYPSTVMVGRVEYLFYNGNGNGETGFGVARRSW